VTSWIPARNEQSVGADQGSARATCCKSRVGRIDLAATTRQENVDAQPKARSRPANFGNVPVERIRRINEHGKVGGIRDEFVQKSK
jgi:hypothetical protein